MNKETARKIAKALLDSQAFKISLDPLFTWTSGIKSPVYCDLRALISDVEIRRIIVKAFAELVKGQDYDVIAGTATAAIPWAAWLAEELSKPNIYVRSEAKEHGTKKRIEGLLNLGQKVLLVEDHISTGKSGVSAIRALREEGGAVVNQVIAINTYGLEEAAKVFAAENVTVQTVTDYDVILEVAVEQGVVQVEQIALLQEFKKNPADFINVLSK